MRSRIHPATLLLFFLSVALASCGSAAAPRQSNAALAAPALGAACLNGGLGEFVRQQQIVHWSVYCPSELPDGFRLARPDDPPDVSQLGGQAPGGELVPTIDQLGPGGGTLITRLVGPNDAQLIFVQGAGASIYTLRDGAGNLIPTSSLIDGAIGDLAARIYTGEPPRVTAFDSLGYGHMVIGYGLSADAVARVAAAMTPVDGSGIRAALFSFADLNSVAPQYWVVAWPPDPTGEDVRAPAICGKGVDEGNRLTEAVVRFEPAPRPDGAPDAGGHGPFLQQAVVTFPPGGAQRYIDQMAAMLSRCGSSYELKAAGGGPMANVVLTRQELADLGDGSLVFRRSLRSPVQGADTDIALVRRGDDLAIVLRFELLPVGGAAAVDAIAPYARLADEKLRSAHNVPPVAEPASTSISATATPDPVTRDRVIAGLPIATFPTNFDYVPYDWSPDGRRIAFVGDGRALYIAEAPKFTPRKLSDGPAAEPRWSPDGKLIAFAHEDDGTLSDIAPDAGIHIIPPDATASSRPLRVSPVDDPWRGRIVRVHRWLDDKTIAYDAHCGSGCQMLFEMTVDRPVGGSPPRTAGVVRQVPFVRNCAECISAALAFFYSPDTRYVVAETGTAPALAWYERASETQWLLTFDDDQRGVELRREFVAWGADSRSFVFREAVVPPGEQPSVWTFWRVDAATRAPTPVAASDVSPATGVAELDRIIGETLAGDKDALASRLAYATMPCVAQGQEGSPPMCEPGQQVGDPVPAFLVAGCGGGWVTPAEAERYVRGVQKPVRFVAAGAPSSALPDQSIDDRLLFAFGAADDANGFWFDVNRGGITGLHSTCGTVTDALRFITPAISTPP